MATLKQRHHKWWAKIRVPGSIADRVGKKFVETNLQTSDRKVAAAKAALWEAQLRVEWAGIDPSLPELSPRRSYLRTREAATVGAFEVHTDSNETPQIEGINFEIDKMADEIGEREPTEAETARLNGLQDALRELRNQKAPVPSEYRAGWSEVAEDFMKDWLRKPELKGSNTEQQKRATYRLFQGFWKDKPLGGIRQADAARFRDTVRTFAPSWARSPDSRKLGWDALVSKFGDHPAGLSTATMNRHMAALGELWKWAKKRGHCEGDNPFEGFRERLKVGTVKGYLPWTDAELQHLLSPAPPRQDLHEIILVALYSGMRIDEIASLTWDQLKEEDGVSYFQVLNAKTEAGNRKVPVHSALGWLLKRTRGKPSERVWFTFNPEGPGKKPGADASREFSRFKGSRGFTDRRKGFHSFRKNVTGIMERARVPQNEWALIVGHERGFTFSVYNPEGITMRQRSEIIENIRYPKVAALADAA